MIGTSYLKDLAVRCRIGCNDAERETDQPLIVSVMCETDMTDAVATDARDRCVDYTELHRIVQDLADVTRYRLLESLAHAIACATLDATRARAVTVDVRKPHKLAGCEAVGIALTLRRPGQ